MEVNENMKVGKSYNTSITTVRVDESNIQPIIEVMQQHPRIKRCISEKGIYLHLQDVTELMEHFNDEIVFRISVSIGDIEHDCFDVGYYSYSNDITIEKIANLVCKENFFGYTCKRMINNYVPLMMKMPAPCQEGLPDKYVSTDEEHVDIAYISEVMCHSIIKKLWNYANLNCGEKKLDKLIKETNLTEDEFKAIMREF